MATTITRVAHSCALLDFAGRVVLSDPWFSEKPGNYRGEALAFTPDTLPTLSAVVASHDHYDIEASAEQVAEYCAVLRPEIAVPIHYAFTAGPVRDRLLLGYDGTPERFRHVAAQRATETTVRILAPGEPLVMESNG